MSALTIVCNSRCSKAAATIQLFQRLNSLGPAYSGFGIWAQSITEQQDHIKLSEATALQQDFYITIDRILSAENATLVLILSDQP